VKNEHCPIPHFHTLLVGRVELVFILEYSFTSSAYSFRVSVSVKTSFQGFFGFYKTRFAILTVQTAPCYVPSF